MNLNKWLNIAAWGNHPLHIALATSSSGACTTTIHAVLLRHGSLDSSDVDK